MGNSSSRNPAVLYNRRSTTGSEDDQRVDLLVALSKSRQMMHILTQVRQVHNQLKYSANSQFILEAWKFYVRQATATYNIFSETLLDPSAISLFSVESGDAESRASRIARHLRLMHQIVDRCLRKIINDDFSGAALSLYSLGNYHSERGVTPAHMNKFIPSFVKTINETQTKAGFHITKEETSMLKSMVSLMVHTMLNGLHRHQNVKVYINMLVEKKGNWWTRRQIRKKCVNKQSKKCWRNLSQQLINDT